MAKNWTCHFTKGYTVVKKMLRWLKSPQHHHHQISPRELPLDLWLFSQNLKTRLHNGFLQKASSVPPICSPNSTGSSFVPWKMSVDWGVHPATFLGWVPTAPDLKRSWWTISMDRTCRAQESLPGYHRWILLNTVDGPAKSDKPPILDGWNMLKPYK